MDTCGAIAIRTASETHGEGLPALRLLAFVVFLATCGGCMPTTSASPRSDAPPPSATLTPQPSATSTPSPTPPVEIVIAEEAVPVWLGPDTFTYATSGTFGAGDRLVVDGTYGEFAVVHSAEESATAGFVPVRLLPGLDDYDLPQLPAREVPPADDLEIDPGRLIASAGSLQIDNSWSLQVPESGWIYVDVELAEGASVEGLAFLAHHPLLAPDEAQQHRLEVTWDQSGQLALEVTYGVDDIRGEPLSTPLGPAPVSRHVLLRLAVAEGGVVGGLEIYDGANPAAPLAEVSGDGLGIHLFRPSLSRLYIGIRCAPNLETLEECGLRSYRAWAVPGGTRDAPSWLVDVSGETVPDPSSVITASNAGRLEPLVEWGDGEILRMEYSPDGTLLLLATTLGGIHLFETSTYQEIQRIETRMALFLPWGDGSCYQCGSASISPDHRIVAVASADGTLSLWRTQDGSRFRTWAIEGARGTSTSSWSQFRTGFSGDGAIVWTTENGILRGMYRVVDGASLHFTPVEGAEVFSSDLRILAASDRWGRPVLYRTNDWTVWDRVPVSLGRLPSRAMTPDGDLLATAGESGNAQVWRIQDDAPVALFTSALPEPPRGLFFDEAVAGFSASGEVVAITAIYAYYHNFTFLPQEASVQVWNTGSRTLMGETTFSIFPSPGVWSPEASVALHPAGDALAYLSAPGLVEIISVPDGRVIGSASTGATCGGDFVVSPGGQLLATYTGNFIVLCRTSDGSIVRRIRVPTGEITDIAFSPDGSMLASSGFTFSYLEASSATYDPNVHVWDVENGSLLRTFSEHQGNIMSVAFSGDGELLAAGGGVRPHRRCADRVSDPRIVVWRMADGQRLWTLDGVPGGTGHLAFSPSGRVLAVTSNACCRWTAPNGLWTYELSDGFRIHRLVSEGCDPLLEPVFSPDGSILAEDSSSLAGSELFDTETMERVGSLPVNAAAFSPSGDLVASPQYPSGIVLVTADGSWIAARSGSLADFRLIFSPDGSRIYSAPEAAPGVMAVWGVPSQP